MYLYLYHNFASTLLYLSPLIDTANFYQLIYKAAIFYANTYHYEYLKQAFNLYPSLNGMAITYNSRMINELKYFHLYSCHSLRISTFH